MERDGRSHGRPRRCTRRVRANVGRLRFPCLPFTRVTPLLPLIFPFLRFRVQGGRVRGEEICLGGNFGDSNVSVSFTFDTSGRSHPLSSGMGYVYHLSLSPGLQAVGSFSSVRQVALRMYRTSEPIFSSVALTIDMSPPVRRDTVTSFGSAPCYSVGQISDSRETLGDSLVARVSFVFSVRVWVGGFAFTYSTQFV